MHFKPANVAALVFSCLFLGCAKQHSSDKSPAKQDPSKTAIDENSSIEQSDNVEINDARSGESNTALGPVFDILNELAPTPVNDFYVVIAGNNSCKPGLLAFDQPFLESNAFFGAFLATLEQTAPAPNPAQVLFVCYGNKTSAMHFYLLSPKYRQLGMRPVDESELDQVVQYFMPYARSLTILGFSYGGGRGMHLAASLAAVAPIPVSLFSVDPINRFDCVRFFDAGCRSSVVDLSPEERELLQERVYWVNFTQPTRILRGVEYCEAKDNIVISKLTLTPHLSLASDDDVWSIIGDNLRATR